MPERFEIYIIYNMRYINTLPFLFPFYLENHRRNFSKFSARVTAVVVVRSFSDGNTISHVHLILLMTSCFYIME